MKYFLSLGSNINAEKNLEFALDELKKYFQTFNPHQFIKQKLKALKVMIF